MFDNSSEVDSLCYQMRLADFTRSSNRARINSLFNGVPPYTDEEVERNNINVNVNYLEGLRIAHDARSQFAQAYQKPGNYFNCKTDFGPVHKRDTWSRIVTKEVNRVMKRSLPFFECLRSKFASNVLHGIGPSVFRNSERWCPQMAGVEDVLIPANTLLTMENLPLFAVYKTFTAPELRRLAKGPRADKAWNQGLVDSILEWIDQTTPTLFSTNWPELWSPEKAGERIKGDSCLYTGDAVPVVNVWDFYFWDDSKKTQGWKRRMIVDAWTSPEAATNAGVNMVRRKGKPFEAKNGFLYNPNDRIYASHISEIINFQFADLSAVAPFRYHTVRSLGFLMYSICHLQNRLRCKFSESVLESLMQYFRVNNADDAQRALKLELVSSGFIDDSIKFVPQAERWQVNSDLAQLGLRENANIINQNGSAYTANLQAQDKREKTKFEVMAEVNAMTSLVSVGLQQSYNYEVFEYREIFRRFLKKDSEDPEVREFQAACLRQGIPMKMLNHDQWELDPERVVGAGNKTLELAISQQLMEYRNLYDPSAQRTILRDVTASITDDPAKAEMLVPEQPQISDSTHDAQLAMGSLMIGLPVAVKSGINRTEYIEALLSGMAIVIKQTQATSNMGSPDKVIGLKNVANHITAHLQLLAQDDSEKQRVRTYGDQLGQMMNLVKGFEQRIMEKQKSQGGGNGQQAEAMAKIQSQLMVSKAKADNTRESHAQRTAQRQLQFEMQQKQKAEEFRQKQEQEAERFRLEFTAERASAGHELVHGVRKSEQEIRTAERKAKAQESAGQE
jgi:hypothetical protein